MVRLSFIVTIITVALACVAFSKEELYSDRYDNVDIEVILANDKQRTQYYNCFMDFKACKTADASFFSGTLTDRIFYVYYIIILCRFLIDSRLIFLNNDTFS